VDPGHRRPGPALETARAVVVDLAAAERAKDFRLGIGEHVAESVQHHRRRVHRQRRRQLTRRTHNFLLPHVVPIGVWYTTV